MIGPVGSGKTTLLNAFLGIPFDENISRTETPFTHHVIVDTSKGYVYLKIVDCHGGLGELSNPGSCDGVILVRHFNGAKSDINWLMTMPSINVRSKADDGYATVDTTEYENFSGSKCRVSAKTGYMCSLPFAYLLREMTGFKDIHILQNKPVIAVHFANQHANVQNIYANDMQSLIRDVNLIPRPHSDAIWAAAAGRYPNIYGVYLNNVLAGSPKVSKTVSAEISKEIPAETPKEFDF